MSECNKSNTLRLRGMMVGHIQELASAESQLAYEQELAGSAAGHAPTELIAIYGDLFDLKNPQFTAAFTRDELLELAHLYGLICECAGASFDTVAEMLKDSSWRRVMEKSKEIDGMSWV